jgi:CxxC motif-containing protein (DUF1111 family)
MELMIMKRTSSPTLMMITTLAAVLCLATPAESVSPDSVARGRQLFERDWTPRNPQLGGDGLGPLFNGQSCVVCHHQGGVGGGGDARFNALTIGIESIKITGGMVDNDVVARMVSTFHPGFVSNKGRVINTLALAHHGGSPMFQSARAELLSQIDAVFSSEGGPPEAAEVRRALATPILFHHQEGRHQISLQARLYQRNTTPMFGAGLIDQITGKQIEAQAKLQQAHPEISGRPATLRSGRYGKFGWRGNVATLLQFVDQACAAEVGLETKRKEQPGDPHTREYRNSTIDISDDQIRAMRDFLTALPTPVRQVPTDPEELEIVQRGEAMFAEIGCAVCHVPNMGPATGIYSDILLHDMGYELIDLNHAEPYITRVTPASRITTSTISSTSGTIMGGQYYGPATDVSVSDAMSRSTGGETVRDRFPRLATRGHSFSFQAPSGPTELMEIVSLGSEDVGVMRDEQTSDRFDGRFGNFVVQSETTVRRHDYLRIHYEPTNFNQEWRTPPLWGLRDSAPYMHDGRAATVLEAIAMHDGESAGTRDRFLQLSLADRQAVLAFLDTFVAPPTAPAHIPNK